MNSQRYHSAAVTLHWLIVILLFTSALLSQQKDMDGLPLNLHMIVGAVLLGMVISHVTLRLKYPRFASENKFAVFIQIVLYISMFFILGMGGWIAYQRNLLGYLIDPDSAIGRGSFKLLAEYHRTAWQLTLGWIFLHAGTVIHRQWRGKKIS